MDNEAAVLRQRCAETRAAIAAKVDELDRQLWTRLQTAAQVADRLENSVRLASRMLESIGNILTPRSSFSRHPWGLIAGALTLGYLGSRLLDRSETAQLQLGTTASEEPRSILPSE